VGFVVLQPKIFEGEVEEGVDLRVQMHGGQRAGSAGELEVGLFQVVAVEVDIPQTVNKVAGLEPGGLGYHEGEKGIRSDVKGQTEKQVGGALVEVAGKPSLGDIELEEHMAGGEGHLFKCRHVPGTHHESTRIGVAANLLKDFGHLVDVATIRAWP
jgi:hypothetical protein